MKNNSYCAFLRGVNVKGTAMKMAEVCSVFEKENVEKVSSILASGNILFSSDKDKKQLKIVLEKSLSTHFDYEAFLFIKSKEEIETLVVKNPLSFSAAFHVYGFVGIDGIEKILADEFEKSKKINGEEAKVEANNFYWKVPKGNTLDSEFGKILGQKKLKNYFTSRNINTFEKVLKKM
ncbi:MAG: DUF1697 domain-containing protein [Bacteroidetes bacterium]|nr:DUF1697 domain-containing protein [Bacteroidota bacterium]